jgi:hypothetical protein
MKLKRKKIGDRNYQLVDAKTGTVVALAAKTGEHGRDNYPWEWHLFENAIFGRLNASTGRSEDSLRDCVDYIESEATSSGILKPVGQVDPYGVKEGQVFRSHGMYFRATQDAYGEFNAYIPANNAKGELTEVLVGHGLLVTLYVEA